MAYDETNRGALFKEDEKKSDNHPDYKGKINVNGQDFWLSAWIKTAETGRKYMSLSVQPKEAQQGQNKAPAPPPRKISAPGSAKSYGSAGSGSQGFDDDADQIPF